MSDVDQPSAPSQAQRSIPRNENGSPPLRRPRAGWPLDYEGEFNVALFAPAFATFLIIFHHFGRFPWASGVLIAMVLVAVVPAGPTLIEQWKHIRFQEWVLDHWDEIESGTANLEGQKVGRGTVLACYPLISSAVVIQLRSPGRPVLRGTASAARARWTSIFVAAVGGWWCLPDGPLATIGVLRRGFRDEPVLVTLEDVAGAILNGKRLGNVSLD